jgi:predicted  nucleic acid-binding Zn-ribbon protein
MLKKLKSLFVVEEEGDKKKEIKPEQPKEQNIPQKDEEDFEVEVSLDIPTPIDPTKKPDPKFVDILLKAIEKNNMDGFDYLEYKQSLQSLQNMNMDEPTRYKSAFAMAKTMGATPEKLLESANHYIAVLKKEESKFKDALVNQRNTQIKGREAKIKSMEQSIAQKKEQIEKLKAEIDASTKKLDSIKSEINKSAAKVEATNERFHLALNVVMGQIANDLEQMKSYLK